MSDDSQDTDSLFFSTTINSIESVTGGGVPPPICSTPPHHQVKENLKAAWTFIIGSTSLIWPWTQQKRRQRPHRMFQLMKQCGYFLAILTFAFVILAIPILTVYAVQEHNVGTDIAAFVSSAAFVILTIPISMYEIFNHLTHWYMPDCQKYVVRILWMVPLYSVQSWFSLRYHQFALYIDTLRDLYEAFVIQSFLYYLVEILGGEDVLSRTLAEKGDSHHGEHGKFLGRFIPSWEIGEEFMLQCKHGKSYN
jgi:hypothetical protein